MIRMQGAHAPREAIRRIFLRGTSRAPGESSSASTRERGKALAQAIAMQPEPVPHRPPGARALDRSTARIRARWLRQGRARNQHALIDVEFEARKPAAVREIDGGHALGDAPLQQRIEGRALPGRDGAAQPRR